MADSKSKTDHGDARRSESESEEPIREAEDGDTQVDDDEWGFYDKKPGLASETKAGIGIIVLLICTFCFLVYRKYDAHGTLADGADDNLPMVAADDSTTQPGDNDGNPFDDKTGGANEDPPPQSEPKPLDAELFSSAEPPDELSPQDNVARADHSTPGFDDPDFFDAPEDNTDDEPMGMIGELANSDESSGFDDFSDPPDDDFVGSSENAAANAAAAHDAAVTTESEIFGDDPIGSFDTGLANEDPLFDDDPARPAVTATTEPKPVDNGFFDDEPSAVVADGPTKRESHKADIFDDPVDKGFNTAATKGDRFDNGSTGLLFDDDPAPKKPEPTTTKPDPIPSRDEIIAADRAASSRLDGKKTEPLDDMDEVQTVRAKPMGRFDDSLFDDDRPSTDAGRSSVGGRAKESATDLSDDTLLFDHSVAADSEHTPLRESVRGSTSVEAAPVDDRLQDQRTARRESKFSTPPPAGRVMFDRSPSGFDDDRRIQAETAVLRREDISEVYVVQPGDNYWRISRNQYGTSRFYMALARLNKQRVEDPRRLKPGMKLHTPSIESLYQRYPELFPNGVQTVTARRSEGLRGFFLAKDGRPMYRTGRSDTLSAIAQNHLGRASRWKQIYQLNRDTLKNPNEVKDGLVLVLPDDASQVRMVR